MKIGHFFFLFRFFFSPRCLDHRRGVLILGAVYVLVSCAVFALTLLWGFSVRHACYG